MNYIEKDTNYSVVEYLGDNSGYQCGYCKSTDTNFSNGMWAHRMKVGHYQELINRGWRRSGKYCYQPMMEKICCPQYTIRCDATQFKLSKSQKKVLKRMHHFLSHGTIKAEANVAMKDTPDSYIKESGSPSLSEHVPSKSNIKAGASDLSVDVPLDQIATAEGFGEETQMPAYESSKAGTSKCDEILEVGQAKKPKLCEVTESKKKCRGNEAKSIEEFLNEPLPQNAAHKLEIRLIECGLELTEFKDNFMESNEVYSKYQTVIHQDPASKCSITNFSRFLCQPLQNWKYKFGPKHGYGTFHQQYWLDGKLIAVGVLDILPRCISSVYLYYDPKYSFLSLGTYASLREIALARQLNQKYADMQWYYMGFYIHSCSKMRYKGNYHPSFLLCPETYTFQPIEKCLPKLDASKYSRLLTSKYSEQKQNKQDVILDKVLCLYRNSPMSFKDYRKKHKCSQEELENVKFYAQLVGQVCAYSILLYKED